MQLFACIKIKLRRPTYVHTYTSITHAHVTVTICALVHAHILSEHTEATRMQITAIRHKRGTARVTYFSFKIKNTPSKFSLLTNVTSSIKTLSQKTTNFCLAIKYAISMCVNEWTSRNIICLDITGTRSASRCID
jgi:hypothetical protein